MLFFKLLRCLMNGRLVHSFDFIRTRVISKIVIIIEVLSYLVTL